MHTAPVEPNWNWIFCCPQADISQSLGSQYFTECSVKPGVGAQTRVPLSILLINIFTECSVKFCFIEIYTSQYTYITYVFYRVLGKFKFKRITQ